MPGIGRPQQAASAFGKISMAPKAKVKNQEEKLDEALNRIAGAEIEEQKYVDRKAHNKLGKDGFLKLLAHQLQNQDPMKPMDQKQFAADLAQFSQLEQLTNMNTKFDKMGANAPQENKFYGASFIGKEIHTKGSTIHYNGADRNVRIPFFLPQQAKNVMVNIYDSKRQLMAQLEADDLGKGQNTLEWNGKQLDGIRAVKDDYTIEVNAYDSQMNKFKGETKAVGLVSGVAFENGETILKLTNGKEVYLRDVDSFSAPVEQSAKQNNAIQNKIPGLNKQAKHSYNKINESL